MVKSSEYRLPDYMEYISKREYMNNNIYDFLNNQNLVNIINLGYSKKLKEVIFEEIGGAKNILQLGNVYGDQITHIASLIGDDVNYDIIDVSPVQIDMLKTKVAPIFSSVNVIKRDAEEVVKNKYDLIICNKLLHDLPDRKKMRVIEASLENLSENGKLLFIEYNKPVKWHPIIPVFRTITRLYKPFMESLWEKEIRDFSVSKTKYNWKKTKYYGDLFQKVVVTKK